MAATEDAMATASDPLPASGPLLAIDWGAKRIGMARCDADRVMAHPAGTLTRRAGRRFPMQQLRRALDAHTPVGVVVGLPLEPDGSIGPNAVRAQACGALIAAKTGLPVAYQDERFSTARAIRTSRELGAPRGRSPGDTTDEMAAAVVLQAYLDQHR